MISRSAAKRSSAPRSMKPKKLHAGRTAGKTPAEADGRQEVQQDEGRDVGGDNATQHNDEDADVLREHRKLEQPDGVQKDDCRIAYDGEVVEGLEIARRIVTENDGEAQPDGRERKGDRDHIDLVPDRAPVEPQVVAHPFQVRVLVNDAPEDAEPEDELGGVDVLTQLVVVHLVVGREDHHENRQLCYVAEEGRYELDLWNGPEAEPQLKTTHRLRELHLQ
eukprot:6058166-Prymnesium_polylepis.1